MPDHPKESTSARYRSLAGECWEIAHTFPAGERRTPLGQKNRDCRKDGEFPFPGVASAGRAG
jgi:hypothetical protein